MILCLLKEYPGVTQISKVSAAVGINGRDNPRRVLDFLKMTDNVVPRPAPG